MLRVGRAGHVGALAADELQHGGEAGTRISSAGLRRNAEILSADPRGEASKLSNGEGSAHGAGHHLDRVRAVLPRHRQHQVGAKQHRLDQKAGSVRRGIRRLGSRVHREVLCRFRHFVTDEGMRAATVDAHAQRFEPCAQHHFCHGGAANIAGADGQDREPALARRCR